MDIVQIISTELKWDEDGVKQAIILFDSGNTLPFIARYRKDHTKGLDEDQLFYLNKRVNQLRKLKEAKEKALKKLDELGILNDRLKEAIKSCEGVSDVNEIMQPYRSKRKTRAMKAREMGLQPLADVIMGRIPKNIQDFILPDAGTKDEQIKYALDIVAEEIIATPEIKQIAEKVIIRSEIELSFDETNENISHYENLRNIHIIPNKLTAHQIHSIFRAESEKIVKLKLKSNSTVIVNEIIKTSKEKPHPNYLSLYKDGVNDGVKRLLIPRAETSIRKKLKEKADLRAIEVFKQNLYNLLLEAPIPPQTIMGIDPGYRTGCKIAIIDKKGNFLENSTIYPTPPKEDILASERVVNKLCKKHGVTFIAIGNGTGSQETNKFIKNIVKKKKLNQINFAVIPETGASVYSASKIARDEFPDLEVEIRGAISIARRILDPLAEYVKIDPKSLGVGQYQHDINQKQLADALDFVVSSAVNKNGINLETASKEALSYIAGITPAIAKNIIQYRNNKGFTNLNDLLKVKRLGENAFEQCSGFLKLKNSKNLLDKTMIHPLFTEVVDMIFQDLNIDILNWNNLKEVERNKKISKLQENNYLNKDVGTEIIKDIFQELILFGKDPRGFRELIDLSEQPESINDLKEKMILNGKVNNVADFGAFIDLGIKHNGLIHKSKMVDRFVTNVHSILKIGDIVKVLILEVDLQRKRISLQLLEVNGMKP
ncbi:MAG: helix-hairpin-helix domain-containing protein [Candidatus Kariarchaeaceae archaeon]